MFAHLHAGVAALVADVAAFELDAELGAAERAPGEGEVLALETVLGEILESLVGAAHGVEAQGERAVELAVEVELHAVGVCAADLRVEGVVGGPAGFAFGFDDEGGELHGFVGGAGGGGGARGRGVLRGCRRGDDKQQEEREDDGGPGAEVYGEHGSVGKLREEQWQRMCLPTADCTAAVFPDCAGKIKRSAGQQSAAGIDARGKKTPSRVTTK
ncbi:MAG: hypothetical protein FJ399_05540 [Verrucomicrobia bacterium]|nr:hypothetical protein [Verrucomicrobiota bacterium]